MATNPAGFANRTALNSSNSALACLDQRQVCSACCIPQLTNLHKETTIQGFFYKIHFH